tara:strand:+ start:182 stop:460 length:279 start_codon:yes stop_codon:yes gene_type:complete
MDETNNEILIPFLRKLASAIEKKELAQPQLQSISEFFMSYQFQEQAYKDCDNSVNTKPNFNEKELIKFVCLGWYVYQVLLRQDTLEVINDPD